MSSVFPTLSLIESRVLGTLVEKQRTVPDTYPLSLNALVAGCNQKTSRNPVIEISEAEALAAIDHLKECGLVHEVSGSRVVRFGHSLEKVFGIPTQASALLTVLLLRGPQTAGELRLNAERLHKFADISSVEAFLDELACRPEGEMLVIEQPRLPGARENRWMHLLCGEPDFDTPTRPTPDAAAGAVIEALTERVNTLEAELAALRSRFERFVAEIGG